MAAVPSPPAPLPEGRGGPSWVAIALCLPACAGCDSGKPSAEQEARLAPFVSTSAPESIAKTDVDFGGKVRLVGFAVSPKQAQYPPGTEVKVTLVWRCDAPVGDGWMLFTHLLGAGGVTVANLDEAGPLRKMDGFVGQPLPPARWEPGKLYRDELTFAIPADPGPTVTVGAGIYKGADRLPIKGTGGDREGRTTMIRLQTGAKDSRAAIKELVVEKLGAGVTIAIDGKLDEPAWAAAPTTGHFVDVGSGRENAALPTQGTAKLAWDAAALYVGFEAKDAKVKGGWPADAKDPHLWEKDTVEIMIDPDGDGDNKDYYELQINPQNLVFDTQYDAYNSPNGGGKGPFGHEEWSAKLESAVRVHGTMDDDSDKDEGYTVEARIPWASFEKAKRSPPADGDAWRMNFYVMQDNGGVAWSPILGQGNFHRASRFGRVRWKEPGGGAAPSASAPPVAK